MRRYLVTECRDPVCAAEHASGRRLFGPSALGCGVCGGPLAALVVVAEEDVIEQERELAALRVSGSARRLLADRAADAALSALGILATDQRLAKRVAAAVVAVVDPGREEPEARVAVDGYSSRR